MCGHWKLGENIGEWLRGYILLVLLHRENYNLLKGAGKYGLHQCCECILYILKLCWIRVSLVTTSNPRSGSYYSI